MDKDIRLTAIKKAFWDNTERVEEELWSIQAACIDNFGTQLSHVQLKEVFDAFPQELIGNGIKWGFDDTEVRGEIIEFIENNQVALKSRMALT